MTMYATKNFKSKAALKRALVAGEKIGVVNKTPWGDEPIENGPVTLSGPWYPEPHKWYGTGQVKDGKLVSVK